ncbi:hypothetical protein [Leucobacter chinensis]|uniref:hypothetical protein n=1 Tax=Leucobacter chinensis TaxID=2851010 RepID=UPI001C24B3AE|nr:hypothetical protein [Leucobacter chinensis]
MSKFEEHTDLELQPMQIAALDELAKANNCAWREQFRVSEALPQEGICHSRVMMAETFMMIRAFIIDHSNKNQSEDCAQL